MTELDGSRESFTKKLLSLINNFQPHNLVLWESVTIQPLGTLTKLVTRHQECLRGIKLQQPIIVVVLQGTKTIYLDDREYTFPMGELFFVPAAISLDVVNQPDPQSHHYIALVLELGDNLIARIKQAYPELIDEIDYQKQGSIEFEITLTPQLKKSFIYLVQSAIENATENNSYLQEHRLMEVLLLLLQSNRRSQFLQLLYPDLPARVSSLIGRDLSLPWSTTQVARELNISVSTLKRKLKEHDLTFREILTRQRMEKAMSLLQENKYAIAEIALACGYESPSRFAARFRQYYALNPSEINIAPAKWTKKAEI